MLAGAQVPWIGPASVGVASLGTKIETASAGDPVWLKVDALVKAHARLDMSSGTLLVARHRADYGRCGRGVKEPSLCEPSLCAGVGPRGARSCAREDQPAGRRPAQPRQEVLE
jgi:hypothetical protein